MAQALAHVQDVTGSLDKIHFMNGGMSIEELSDPNRMANC